MPSQSSPELSGLNKRPEMTKVLFLSPSRRTSARIFVDYFFLDEANSVAVLPFLNQELLTLDLAKPNVETFAVSRAFQDQTKK